MINSDFTVLVVDDDPDLLEVLVIIFEGEGFKVFSAGDGGEAINLVKSKNIDVVVSDIRMPTVGGVELLKQIKQHNPHKPIVIFVTGFSDITEKQALEAGASAIFTKPFNKKTLLEKIKAELEKP